MTTKVVMSVGDSSIQFKRKNNACSFFGALCSNEVPMGSEPGSEPIGTSFEHKAPRVEAFFLEKLVFLPEPLRPHPNEDPNLKN